MKLEKALKSVVCVSLFLVLAFTLASAQMGMQMGTASMKSLEKAAGKKFDIAWLSQMIEHHTGALEMSQNVVKHGKKDFVIKAAKSIIAAQTTEIKQMTGWLKAWYNTVPDKAQMKLMREDMKPMLEMSKPAMPGMDMGDDTDKLFLEGMIGHHQSAVDMGKLALKKAARLELKKFAQKVIADQTKEITQYKAWLKGWK
jgi:uncharacterized protein (DUF305 family)